MQTMAIDKHNALLIGGVLLVTGFVGFYLPYRRSKNPPVQPNVTGIAEVSVLYHADGFVPQEITVEEGATVAWSNPSGRPMWVASDPHPAHTDLKGFDQLRVINRARPTISKKVRAHGGGVYEYTFVKAGTWKYHNHLNPTHNGTVHVIPKK